MLTIEDIVNYDKTQLALSMRSENLFNKYKESGCVFDPHSHYDGFDVDGTLKQVDIWYKSFTNEDYPTTFVITLPFEIFVSDEKVDEDIKRRVDEMQLIPSEFPFDKNTKVYIAGKMTGLEVDDIMNRFNSTEKFLIEKGYAVMNPAVLWNLGDPSRFDRNEYLQINYAMIDQCDVLVVLPDFEDSYGTTREIKYAMEIGIPVYYLDKENNFYIR